MFDLWRIAYWKKFAQEMLVAVGCEEAQHDMLQHSCCFATTLARSGAVVEAFERLPGSVCLRFVLEASRTIFGTMSRPLKALQEYWALLEGGFKPRVD